MQPQVLGQIELEIAHLRCRYAALTRERPEAREVSARWVAAAAELCWFVPLQDVAEPDIDVEITREVLIVRASRTGAESIVLVGLLPVPHGFDPATAVIRFTQETLEVRIRRSACGSVR